MNGKISYSFGVLLPDTHTPPGQTVHVDTLSDNAESQLHAKRVNNAYCHVVPPVQTLKISFFLYLYIQITVDINKKNTCLSQRRV